MENDFTTLKDVAVVLEQYDFFGDTVKRHGNDRITYTFRSVKWNKTTITVETLKLKPNVLNGKKIVTSISINGHEMESFEKFKEAINFMFKNNKHAKR